MTNERSLVNSTRRKIIVGVPSLGVLTACGGGVVKVTGMGGSTASEAQMPAISPPGGTYPNSQSVSLSTPTPGATIYYSTDGSIPTPSSAAYSSPISISASKTVQAISAAEGLQPSAVATAKFTIEQAISSATTSYDGVISVSGAALINGAGKTVQLRGVNFGSWGSAVIANTNQPSGAEDLSGGTYIFEQADGPNLNYFQQWKANCVRIGPPVASWLGYNCYVAGAVNGDGTTGVINPDPHGTYKSQFIAEVAALNAIGCYVCIVNAFTNPGHSATLGQDVLPNQDNDIQFWTSMANTFGYPNGTALKRNGGTLDDQSVIFELWNEPQNYGDTVGNWDLLMNGGFYSGPYSANAIGARGGSYQAVYCWPVNTPTGAFVSGESVTITGGITGTFFDYYVNNSTGYASSGTKMIHLYGLSSTSLPSGATITGAISGATTGITNTTTGYYVAGLSQILAAIRATGAQNVCLLPGLSYNQDLGEWATYAPSDSTEPKGYSGTGWRPQIGASWHPYPACSWISSLGIANGGNGYAVNDTILLPMGESGDANSNSVYWQAQLKVTAVNGGAITAATPVSYVGGTPGAAGGNFTQFNFNNATGGVYLNTNLPSNPVGQYSTSGSGSGATFNLTFTQAQANSGTGDWPNYDTWSQVLALKTTPGVPVVITETGEHTGTGISGSPWMAKMTSWCDANDISLLAYSYNPSPGWYDATGYDFALALPTLTNGLYHTPTPGYGEFMFNWFTTHSP
jgi:hypothetical protein